MSIGPTRSKSHRQVVDQGLAALIEQWNHERRIPLYEALDSLKEQLDIQDKAFARALAELDWVRSKIGTPENILGNATTKHGEIAEMTEVALRRAQDALRGRDPTAIWHDAGDRFGPADYTIGSAGVQSKFINGINNGLGHVLSHATKYPDFASSPDNYYHIPKDQYEQIQKVLAGETDGLNPRTVRAIQEKIKQLTSTGRSFDDLVRPASHNYADVQQGRIHQTVDQHASDLSRDNETARARIMDENQESIRKAELEAAPSLGEAGKVAATGAAVGAGIELSMRLYQKWKQEGKSPTQFTGDDWAEIGGATLSGAATGAVSAGSLYLLTNYTALAAPFAGAVVSSGRAILSLAKDYQDGNISFEEFSELSVIATSEAGIVAAGAALGQTIIPVPLVGAVIGSAIARLATNHVRNALESHGQTFEELLTTQLEMQFAQLDENLRGVLARIEAELLRLGDITSMAFDRNLNTSLLLATSVDLAVAYAVPETRILRSTADVDRYILGEN